MTRTPRPNARASALALTFVVSSLGALPLVAASCGVHTNILEDEQASSGSPVAAWMQAVCNVRRACCGPDPDALNALAGCEAELDGRFGLQAAQDAGRLTTNAAVLRQCVAAAKLPASCAAAEPDFAPCRGALAGLVPEGGTCRSSYECARGAGGTPAVCVKAAILNTDVWEPSDTGVCHASPLGKEGDACMLAVSASFEEAEQTAEAAVASMSSLPIVRCSREQGLTCAGTCTRLGGVGDACAATELCARGLVCGCGLCQQDARLAAAVAVTCVDGACQQVCPTPSAAPGNEYCVEKVAASDGQCRVAPLGCGITDDCPRTWAAAQSFDSCRGASGTFVLGACGDTFTWYREVPGITCHYDKVSGNLVGVRNESAVPDLFCFGASPPRFERLAGHVPPNCPAPGTGTVVACTPGCDGGA